MATTANRLRLDDVMKDRGLARDPPQERPSIEDSPVMEAFFNKVGALPDTLYSITGIPRAVGVAREGRSQGILGQYHPSKDSVALRPIYSRDRSVNNPPAENLSDQMAGTFIHEMGHRLQDSIQGRQLEAAAGFTDKLSDEEERILELENRAFETMQDVNLDSVSTPFNLRRAQRHPPEAFAHTFGRAMQALRRAQKKARESDRIPAEVLDEEVKKEEDTAPAVGEFVDYFLDQPIFQGSEMRRSRDIRSAKQGRVPARDHTRVSRPPEGSPIIETLGG